MNFSNILLIKKRAAPGAFKRKIKAQSRHWQLYLLFMFPLVHIIVFSYIPIYGVQMAFKEFVANKPIWAQEWVGLKYFQRFFESHMFTRVLSNTLRISIASLFLGFPIPIMFAVMLNEIRSMRLKKLIQTVTYAPYFISMITMCGILLQFLDTRIGMIPRIVSFLGGEKANYIADPKNFTAIYVLSGLWQTTGYSAVIYLAALSSVDLELYESAVLDGANRLQKIVHIDLPSIKPTIVIMLILSIGNIMNIGFEKAYLLQNPLNLAASELIATYVYKIGLLRVQYSYSAAIGLFNSVINFVLLIIANSISKRLNAVGLW